MPDIENHDPRALASDGLPPIDIIEVATSILLNGARRETQVSQREVRAMAHAINDFNQAMCQASALVFYAELYDATPDPTVLKNAQHYGDSLRVWCVKMGYMPEAKNVEPVKS